MKKQSQNGAKECASMPPRGLSCLLAQHCPQMALCWLCHAKQGSAQTVCGYTV